MKANTLKTAIRLIPVVAALQLAHVAGAQEQASAVPGTLALKLNAAKVRADATQNMMLGAALAGSRIVAVGEHGVVLLSDDNGAHFRQAKGVPSDSTLTSVTFVDAKHGWAAGHWGVILKTDDGGETWALQRSDTTVDQPVFSIAFRDAQHGWAVGLWSLLLSTDDGGHTWKRQTLDAGKGTGAGKSGLNLYAVFMGAQQDLYIAGEQGTVFKSADNGGSWQATQTGYKGTLWSGTVSADRVLYVGGLRGNLFASHDGGATWQSMPSGAGDSITDLKSTPQGVVGVALDGSVTQLKAGQSGFVARRLPGHDVLTALVVAPNGSTVLFSKDGVVAR
ncbi:WD40/YVTN/BNR-like repeat-containing protein [Ralstonia soli]|uniref:YCF48-related protein n=1 Tax=Ralstonia soli TaxID=2953896 RepID=A0ABT1AGV3_9RALS|nr:YCF48-related protein [Ralstonia soli]MCO5397613.1 YCF48-related protein [Ralstonia soli]